MKIDNLKKLLSQGKTKQVIQSFVESANLFESDMYKEVILLSARFNIIEEDKKMNVITPDDYRVQINKINQSAIELVFLIDESTLNEGAAQPNIPLSKKITILAQEFDQLTFKDENVESKYALRLKLKMKNELAKNIRDKFIHNPSLITEFIPSQKDGIICGICKKIQFQPEFGDLDIIEQLAKDLNSNFTKGNITNAIAELIYYYKLQLGDEDRILHILDHLKVGADKPLLKNIERVEVALAYLIK